MFTYGVVAGYYGPIWSVETFQDYASFCKDYGYSYFIYGPKKDSSLREGWATPFTDQQIENLTQIRNAFESQGVAFGLGLSPYGLNSLDDKSKKTLAAKIKQINDINPSILGVFFDDIEKESVSADLGVGQVAVAEYSASVSNAKAFISVPTYYSHDQILQRVLGPTPPRYFSDFAALDAQFDVFWTGEHIISAGFASDEIAAISQKLKRDVTIWDNYPVNDPSYLNDYLRLFGLTSRAKQDIGSAKSIAFNPMLQPYASMIPLATARNLYSDKDYRPREAYLQAMLDLCGPEFAVTVDQNLNYLVLRGLQLTEQSNINRMIEEFSRFKTGKAATFAADFLALLQKYKGS